MLRQDRATGVRGVGRRRQHVGAEHLHEDAPVRLLLERGLHHVDRALQPEDAARHRHGRAPLPRAGLGGDPTDPGLLVEVGLRHSGVRLVRPGRRHALVLEVDAGGRLQRLLQPCRAEQRGRPPQPVDVDDRTGDVDPLVGGDLLHDQAHREQGRQVRGPDRLLGHGTQRRERGDLLRQVGHDVEPGRRHVFGSKVESGALLAHGEASSIATSGARAYRAGRSMAIGTEWEDGAGDATSRALRASEGRVDSALYPSTSWEGCMSVPRRRRVGAIAFAVSVVLATTGITSPPMAHAGGNGPSVRLVSAVDTVTLKRPPGRRAYLDLGTYVASVGGAFEIWATRPDYDTPVSVSQVVRSGATHHHVPTPVVGRARLEGAVEVPARGRDRSPTATSCSIGTTRSAPARVSSLG